MTTSTHPDTIREGEEVIAEILANPRMVQHIKEGMTPKEAVRCELEAFVDFWNKTDRNTAKGKELDNLAREVTFNKIWNTLTTSPA